jgi:hypothetical protein
VIPREKPVIQEIKPIKSDFNTRRDSQELNEPYSNIRKEMLVDNANPNKSFAYGPIKKVDTGYESKQFRPNEGKGELKLL